jgi:TolB-like protein/DNA-binding winged helix-turn-helix (wHTH) protein
MILQNDSSETSPDEVAEYHFAGHRLDVRQRRLLSPAGEPVTLSSRAFDTLLALLEHRGEVLSKATLMSLVWPNVVVEENNLNQAISSLRKALGATRSDKGDSRLILTVPGRGYSFVAEVERLMLPAAGAEPTDSAAPPPAPAAASAAARTAGRTVAAGGPPRYFGKAAPALALAAVLLLAAGLLLWWPGATPDNSNPRFTTTTAPGTAAAGSDSQVIRNSIAVLPFTRLNPDGEHALFTLGLHDEIISQLSKIRSLNVIARSSVVPLVEQQLSTTELAQILRVESVMSGTLLFAEDRARVNLQLVDPRTGLMLWSDTYDADTRDLSAMIAIQSDIAEHVARALEAEILQSERERIESLPTSSFSAYRYNLAAKNAHYQQDFQQEWQLARQAVELDPDYFDAWFTFTSVNSVLVGTPLPGLSGKEHYELTLQGAERMIALDPGHPFGYALKAVALGTVPDWAGVAEMKSILERMNSPLADQRFIAMLLMCLGRFQEAIDIYEANLVTEPINLFSRGFLMAAHELAGNAAAADAEYRLGEELNPVWWGDQVNLFLALGRGQPLEDIDDLFIPDELKQLLHNINDHARLETAVRDYAASDNKVSATSLYYAAFAARLGDQEQAVTLLRSALDGVWTSLFWAWMPVFDETRRLDSFKQLVRDSGVVDYWQQHGWSEVCRPVGDDIDCNWSAHRTITLR